MKCWILLYHKSKVEAAIGKTKHQQLNRRMCLECIPTVLYPSLYSVCILAFWSYTTNVLRVQITFSSIKNLCLKIQKMVYGMKRSHICKKPMFYIWNKNEEKTVIDIKTKSCCHFLNAKLLWEYIVSRILYFLIVSYGGSSYDFKDI